MFSPLFAAQEAVKGFKQLPQSETKTFIFTGNALNQIVNPGVVTFAMAKTAMARMVTYASAAYKDQGYKYFPPFIQSSIMILTCSLDSTTPMNVSLTGDQQFLLVAQQLRERILSLWRIKHRDPRSTLLSMGKDT